MWQSRRFMLRRSRCSLRAFAAAVAGLAIVVGDAAGAQPSNATGLVPGTPERMFAEALRTAEQGGPGALAALAVVHELWNTLPVGSTSRSLASLHVHGPNAVAIQDQARWLAAALAPRSSAAAPPGLVRAWAIAGPFEDAGGHLLQHEGPEAPPIDGAPPAVAWDRGAIQVRSRIVPDRFLSADGIPLNLLVHPRTEACTYLSSRLVLPHAASFVLHVAAAGAVRIAWNGQDAATQEEMHEGAVFDRVALRIDADAGSHKLLVKVCSGPLEDDGRVRVRVTDLAGRDADLPWNAELDAAAGTSAARVTPVRTLMEAAMILAPHAPTSAALQAALVRRFGGAEDLRTPRVPALLDAVVRDPRLAPASLALAGWATSFGAEGTGRLLLAWNRAVARHDDQTADFVLRRLAERRLDAGYADWAMAAVRSRPFADAHDVEAQTIRALCYAAIPSLRPEAVTQLRATALAFPEIPSVWSALEASSRTIDRRVHAEAIAGLWRTSADADCSDTVRSAALQSADAAVEKAQACMARSARDVQELLDAGRALLEVGKLNDARLVFETATILAPNRMGGFSGLAEACEGTQCVQSALQRAIELEPADSILRGRLALHRVPSPRPEDPAIVDPSVFLARKNASPALVGSHSERELHWLRKVEVLEDRRVAQTIHYAREIVIPPRTPRELEEDLPVDSGSVEILRARVHRASGGVAFAEEQQNDGAQSRIRWPELRQGDVVEVALRTVTSGPVGRRGDPPFFFVDSAGATETAPLLFSEVIVDSPVVQPLAIDVLHGEPDRREEREAGGRRIVRMIWDHPVNVADEPLLPDATEIVPTVVGSTFSSWPEFLGWYRTAVQGFAEPDAQIRALSAELTAGLTTRDQKVSKLFAFVADEIRYVNFVSGEDWLPNRPQAVLARRQGDCDDKAILLIALLKAEGIEATEVLLQSRFTGQGSVLRAAHAAVPLFDHGIAYLPGVAGAPGTWLDATNPQSRPGALPSFDARALAVFVHQGNDGPVDTPSGSPEDHGVTGTWTIRLETSGSGEIDVEETHAGDAGQELRSGLEDAASRGPWVEKHLLAGWFDGVRVSSDVDFAGDVGRGVAKVKVKARSSRIARREGADLVVAVAPSWTLTGELATLAVRSQPLVLPPDAAPGHERRVLQIEAPDGYLVGQLPPGGTRDGGAFGVARLEFASEPARPGRVTVTRSLVMAQSVIPAGEYRAWRAWLQAVDALFQRSVRFVPQERR